MDLCLNIILHVVSLILLLLLASITSGLVVGIVGLNEASLDSLSHEKKYKKSIAKTRWLLKHHHLTLVTLLLVNALCVESLPVLIGNWTHGFYAVVCSTIFLLIFAEIIPQAIFTSKWQLCLTLNAASFAVVLVYIFYIISKPFAFVLDKLIGLRGEHQKSGRTHYLLKDQAISQAPYNDYVLTNYFSIADCKHISSCNFNRVVFFTKATCGLIGKQIDELPTIEYSVLRKEKQFNFSFSPKTKIISISHGDKILGFTSYDFLVEYCNNIRTTTKLKLKVPIIAEKNDLVINTLSVMRKKNVGFCVLLNVNKSVYMAWHAFLDTSCLNLENNAIAKRHLRYITMKQILSLI